jgi:hypothetical protein
MLANTVMALLDRAGITIKVSCSALAVTTALTSFKAGHFTVDNASNNKTMMKELEILFLACDIPVRATLRSGPEGPILARENQSY